MASGGKRLLGGCLPVHGFVLAGGRSSRMGRDKALLELACQPLIEHAVSKLRSICAEVSIAGNRGDLAGWAPVAGERRVECGPAAGVEAGLAAAQMEWCLFVPVDVPFVPARLLSSFAAAAIEGGKGSYLVAGGQPQPAFCMLHREALTAVTEALEAGERSLMRIFARVGDVRAWEAESFVDCRPEQVEVWFSNLNTASDLAVAEALARRGMPY